MILLLIGSATLLQAAGSDAPAALQSVEQGESERRAFHPEQGLKIAERVLAERADSPAGDTIWLRAAALAGGCLQDLGYIHRADTLLAEATRRAAVLGSASPRTRAGLYFTRIEVEIDLGKIQVADSLLSLAEPLCNWADQSDSKVLAEFCVTRANLALQKGHVDQADSLCYLLERRADLQVGEPTLLTYNVAQLRTSILYDQGRYDAADTAARHLAALAAANIGTDQFRYAVALTRQAFIAKYLGQYDESERLHRESLRIREAVLPQNNVYCLNGLENLSGILWLRGKYEEADRLAVRALDLTGRLFGHKTLRYSKALTTVGFGLFARGEFFKADTLFQTVLDIQRRILGDSTLVVANTMINLAEVNRILNRPNIAERYLERSLQIRIGLLGESHALVAQTMNSLARVRLDQKKTDGVEELLQKALRIRAASLGTDSQQYAQTLNWLADTYELEGRAAEATPLLIRALEIRRKRLGNYHSNTWKNLRRLANNYVVRHLADSALTTFEEFFARQREYMSHVLSDASESDKLQWAYDNEPHDDSFFSFMLQSSREDVRTAGYREVLSDKAAVLEALMLEREAAVCSDDPIIAELSRRLKSVRSRVSSVILGRVELPDTKDGRDSLRSWIATEDSLGAELSMRCADYARLENQLNVQPAAVCSSLAKDQVILDYVRYVPVSFDSLQADVYKRGGHHYLLFVVSRAGVQAAIDLGPVTVIDSLVTEIVEHINGAENRLYLPLTAQYEIELKALTRALYDLVVAPAAAFTADASHLIVSPEGALCLVPFQVLCDSDDAYLVERFDISYVVSAREIPRWRAVPPRRGEAWIVADPDYDAPLSPPPSEARAMSAAARFRTMENTPAPSASPTDCLPDSFQQMTYADDEAHQVQAALKEAKCCDSVLIFSGAGASELLFDTITVSPDLLHIITHGYFCAGEERPALGASVSAVSPLVGSGLILAGANLGHADTVSGSDIDDGILTALEISGLPLEGTDLVTLSACATGVGNVFGSEGILGLNRAFLHAGARSVVMSLWEVPDYETSALMSRFYRSYADGRSKAAALREASLAMMKEMSRRYGHTHPAAWGSFILYGNWH